MRSLTIKGEQVTCPVCFLVRSEKANLVLTGKRYRPIEDQSLECPNCGRQWESTRYFFDYFVTRVVPKIEAEAEARSLVDKGKQEEEYAEWAWMREKKATAAVEAGTWSPTESKHHLK